MQLTKQEAIENHRKLWNWIADETEKRECCVDKRSYFYEKSNLEEKIPYQKCFCCEYAILQKVEGVDFCILCPVQWNTTSNSFMCVSGEYGQWYRAFENNDYERATMIARKIANLPERKD